MKISISIMYPSSFKRGESNFENFKKEKNLTLGYGKAKGGKGFQRERGKLTFQVEFRVKNGQI